MRGQPIWKEQLIWKEAIHVEMIALWHEAIDIELIHFYVLQYNTVLII